MHPIGADKVLDLANRDDQMSLMEDYFPGTNERQKQGELNRVHEVIHKLNGDGIHAK